MRLSRLTVYILCLAILAGFLVLSRYLLEDLEAQTLQATEEAMVDFAEVIAADLSSGGEPLAWDERIFSAKGRETLDAKIFRHRKKDINLSFYVTDSGGRIIHDSAGVHRPGTDLSHMRDVALTLEGKYGARSSRLFKEVANSSVLHIASPIFADGPDAPITGVITLRKPQADVLPFVTDRQRIITSSAFLIGIGISAFAAAVFFWVWRPIGRLTRYAEAISDGGRPARPRLGRGREVNTLGSALYSMREKLEGRNYVENYVQTLTHELKSPIAGIQGAAELLREDLPPDQRDRFVENIGLEARRMNRLVSSLLQLAALEGRDTTSTSKEVDLVKIIHQAADNAKERTHAAGVSIGTTALPTDPVIVTGDPALLKLAISNVLENAISFSTAGQAITLELGTTSNEARISIADEGPGIPEFARDRVFERFYSLDRPGQPKSRSTGLGLAFVKECAALHSGEVTFTTSPSGTTFTITLPLTPRA